MKGKGRQLKAFLGGTSWLLKNSLTNKKIKKNRRVKLDGISDRVDILYDHAGVPHVRAKNLSDMYFAQGYVTAEARAFQLDLFRRSAGGRLSEIFGKRTLAGDTFQRRLGLRDLAERKVKMMPEDIFIKMDSYAKGVSCFFETGARALEFVLLDYKPEPWTAEDSMLCGEMRAIVNASWRADLVMLKALSRVGPERARELFLHYGMPDGDDHFVDIGKDDTEFFFQVLDSLKESEEALSLVGLQHNDTGTNTWVVDGSHTKTKKPLLANDLHMGFVVPNLNVLIHLKSEDVDARGLAFPGIPGVHVGHNQKIAWGGAALMADAQDIFLEKLDDSGTKYLFKDEWKEMTIWKEEIKIRDKKPVTIDFKRTHHGPIIKANKKWGLALCWERLDLFHDDPSFYRLNTATDWESFRESVSDYISPICDYTYADIHGNIGCQSAGRVPIRSAGDGSLPAIGATGTHDWCGYIDYEDLPSTYNPAHGYIIRSNNNHDADACKHFLSRRWHPPYRAQRIRELITSAKEPHCVKSFSDIQHDRYSYHGIYMADKILAEVRKVDNGRRWSLAINTLESWDGMLTPDSLGASIIKECSAVLKQIIFKKLGKSLLLEYQKNWPSSNLAVEWILENEVKEWLPEEISSFKELYQNVFSTALNNLTKSFQTDDMTEWKWGKRNYVRFAHSLDKAPLFGSVFKIDPLEVGGDGECVFSSRSIGDYISLQQKTMLGNKDVLAAVFGTSTRFIIDLDDFENSSLLLNLGQSGNPLSRHYKDQLKLWQNGHLQKIPYSDENVEKACKGRLILHPKK